MLLKEFIFKAYQLIFINTKKEFANLNSTHTLNTNFLNSKFLNTQFKDVHCSLDAKFSEGVMVNITSSIEEKVYGSKLKNICSMHPNGDYIINPMTVKSVS